ncbi:HAD-like protein [Punctularia strigosozonata HHB-11173 SS5]|uniref:HAD-like protein n=1 Tax=Punctularia strigosozonata (strain HHB-11173) TaxID=741275 RepID=UPI0004417E3A|nr:HAD-like protein [Punctularia strigosozonata HHB-11173 SS5]EIN13436.1 HAD-like protein [Punctularia strigosozonata HHB-11173 SS5]
MSLPLSGTRSAGLGLPHHSPESSHAPLSTLIDSTPGVYKAWNTFARDYDLNATEVAHASHGRRLDDTLKEWCKIDDEDKLQAEIVRFEDEVLEGGPTVLPGVHALLKQIRDGASDQSHGWTIVTSASNIYTPKALSRCGIDLPPAGLVTSNDVSAGKPHPDPYLAGAKKCGVDPKNCLVVEDAPSGLKAGRAAGAKTLAVCTSHTREYLEKSDAKPDYIVQDLTKVSVNWKVGKLEVTIDES